MTIDPLRIARAFLQVDAGGPGTDAENALRREYQFRWGPSNKSDPLQRKELFKEEEEQYWDPTKKQWIKGPLPAELKKKAGALDPIGWLPKDVKKFYGDYIVAINGRVGLVQIKDPGMEKQMPQHVMDLIRDLKKGVEDLPGGKEVQFYKWNSEHKKYEEVKWDSGSKSYKIM